MESQPATKYGLTQAQLTHIMHFGDKLGVGKVKEQGGTSEIASHLLTNAKGGISNNEAELEERRREFGKNYIEPIPPKSFLALMFDALQDKVLLILLVCALLSIVLSLIVASPEERPTIWVEGAAILLAVVIVVLVTAVNDYTKEQQFRDLQKRLETSSKYTVIRDAVRYEVNAADIVVGDILEFKYGNTFPCDGLLIHGNDVSVSESALTGETENIKKREESNPFLYSGTQVMEGSGTMLVIAVGVNSQQGIIFSLMAQRASEDIGFITAFLIKIRDSVVKCCCKDSRKPVSTDEELANNELLNTRNANLQKNAPPPDAEEEEEEEEVKLTLCEKINPRLCWQRRKEKKARKKKEKKSEVNHGSILQRKLTKLALQIGYGGMFAAMLSIIVTSLKFAIEEYGIAGRGWMGTDAVQFLSFVINGITVLVVAVPEGLPLAVTIALAYSVKKMLNDNNLVRHLHSCETMGNATCICSDKTGTLTTNRMTVVDSFLGQKRYSNNFPPAEELNPLLVEVLQEVIAVNSSYSSSLHRPQDGSGKNSDGIIQQLRNRFNRKPKKTGDEEKGDVTSNNEEEPLTIPELQALVRGEGGTFVSQIGNSTECALLGLLVQLGIDYELVRADHPKETFTKQFSFNSERKSMSTIIPLPEGRGYRLLMKGASELVLSKCTSIMGATGEITPLEEVTREDINADIIQNMASNALRTIGLAYRDYPAHPSQPLDSDEITVESPGYNWDDEDGIITDLVLVGIVGIEDPVREEVRDSIRRCQGAGITVRMVTGDNIETARAIAEKCGIIPKGASKALVMEGPRFRSKVTVKNSTGELELVQEKVDRIWPRLRVLARSSPQDKYLLVDGIINSRTNKNREVVAVTGDGTNDGPALKRADVGFAMGIAGTDVAKEACDIILTDDNFTSIVKAVKWGRNVYDAISKFLQFQLTVNIVAVLLVLIGSFSIGDTPLRAIQLLWVNLVMDTFASLALATEPPTDELLKRKPYGRKKALISRYMYLFILGHSLYQLTVLIVLLFAGPMLFDIDEDEGDHIFAPPSEHFSLIFNTFVFMQIFNEVNARKVHGERNVFSGIHRNYIFIVIMFFQIVFQIIWVEVPFLNTNIFKSTSLSADLWLWCIFLGSLEWLWHQLLLFIPVERFPSIRKLFRRQEDQPDENEYDDDDVDFDPSKARVLWIKSFNRLRAQIRVVNAFKASMESDLYVQYTATPRSNRYDNSNDGNIQIHDETEV